MTSIRELPASALHRIREIDRSERITQQYTSVGGTLVLHDVDLQASRWGEPGAARFEELLGNWRPLLADGGVLLGAFDDERLVGFAIYRPVLSEGVANLAVLHVTRTHRRRGIARALTRTIIDRARIDGARQLYVSATPTRGTVDFYLGQGFIPLATPDAEMFALEPEDIHMALVL